MSGGGDLDRLLGLGGPVGKESGTSSASPAAHGAASRRADAGLPGASGAGGAESDGPGDSDEGLRWLRPEELSPNRYQPRDHFDDGELEALTASVAELGVLQPLLARPRPEGGYELVAGERRWRAAQRAGLDRVPVFVRDADDRASLEQAVVENLHRQDLSPVEEAAAYRQLMDDFGLTQDEVAARVGKSRSAVANMLRLLQLSPEVQRLVATGQLSAGHARALVMVNDQAVQGELAARIVLQELSVRETESLVRRVRGGDGGGIGGRGGSMAGGKGSRRPSGEPALREIEQLLGDRLSTRVSASLAGGRGRLVIEFADLDDLDRIGRELL